MVFLEAIEDYKNNITTAGAFILLLSFILPFSWLSNLVVSSGTVMIDYGFLKRPLAESALLLLLALAFLFFYSVLVCLMIFAVRADFNRVKVHYYLSEKIAKFGIKYFQFLAIFTVAAAILSSLLIDLGVPTLMINAALFIAAVPFLFLGQAIVVDEESLRASVTSSLEFILKNPPAFLIAFVSGFLAVTLLQVFEFLLDLAFGVGGFVSLVVALVVLVPLFEALKTELYMGKFEIFRPYRSSGL